MAKVEVDLSEFDMLRQAKDNAEKRVAELSEEVKKLKDTASNVVVKNRYYLPSLNYHEAAKKIMDQLGRVNMGSVLCRARMDVDNFGFLPQSYLDDKYFIDSFSNLIQDSLKDFLDMKSSYVEDAATLEVRGFDEVKDSIRQKLEEQNKELFQQREKRLEEKISLYERKKDELDSEFAKYKQRYESEHTKMIERLKKEHEIELTKLKEEREEDKKAHADTTKNLKEQLAEASKTSEQKLAEAMEKLKAAQEEVAKYSEKKRGLFGKLFK